VEIPFNVPYYTGREIQLIEDVFARGQTCGDGYYTQLCSDLLKTKFGAKKVLLTTSATHALELAVLLLELRPGDEVIMPSFTFPSTANAVLLRGGAPVFAEIDPETLNIDPKAVAARITKRTKAIIPVHYGGISCAMDELMALADSQRIAVIEDAAQAVNASYNGRYLGTWGQFGCFSFHGTKNFSCGEGGAMLLNIEDPAILKRADILIQKGTNRKQFLQGEVAKYCWVDQGSSYTPSEILMAILYAQLQAMDEITKRRKLIHQRYSDGLRPFVTEGTIRISVIPPHCQSNYHLFYIIFENETLRDRVKRKLGERGITSAFHYTPLHSSPMGQSLGYAPADLPVTEELSRRLLRLPLSTGMADAEVEYVISNLTAILEGLTK
jgi:dTDP-4-amino-4,6-dideoxygalactose transaminase